ncbi:hypothetical protein [Aliamphritea hakodatensis]|uniref:hypothetical protein n=1 Tax=Aliamphritea hakodatensis TaxID=2895352 RepID=UPI0022FD62F7|nr:hypothetical protein [Aliamphritea hakodatensis]
MEKNEEISIELRLSEAQFKKALENNSKRYRKALQDMGNSARSESRKMNDAMAVLGHKSHKSIQREIDKTKAAYNRMARGGEVSAQELTAAHQAMVRKVQKLESQLVVSMEKVPTAAQVQAEKISKAMDVLGHTSHSKIRAQIEETKAAYRVLAEAGELSADEIALAYDSMVRDVEKLESRLQRTVEEMPTAAQVQAEKISKAMDVLGHTSHSKIRAQIEETKAAYRVLAEAGELSADEIALAYDSMVRDVEKLESRLQRTVEEVPTAAQVQAEKISKAMDVLGHTSHSKIRAQIEETKAAYKSLADAGDLSADELALAYQNMTDKVDRLQRSMKLETKEVTQVVRTEADKTARAMELLGHKPHSKIRREIAQTQAAYKRLADGGTLSAKELSQAHKKMKAEVARLKGEVNGAADAGSGLGSVLQAAALVAAGAQFTVMVNDLANLRREMEQGAAVALSSTEEYEKFIYSVGAVTGLQSDKLGQMLKDVQDKVGDFLANDGGEFKDFFEKVQGRVDLTAESLSGLSSQQIIERVADAMAVANVPATQQVNLWEALGDEAVRVGIAYTGQRKELEALRAEYDQLNLSLSEQDSAVLEALAVNISTLGKAWETTKSEFAADLAPSIGAALDELTKIIRSTDDAVVSLDLLSNVAGGAGAGAAVLALTGVVRGLNFAFTALAGNPIGLAIAGLTSAAVFAYSQINDALIAQQKLVDIPTEQAALYQQLADSQRAFMQLNQQGAAEAVAGIRQQYNLGKISAAEALHQVEKLSDRRVQLLDDLQKKQQAAAGLEVKLQEEAAKQVIKSSKARVAALESDIKGSTKRIETFAKTIKDLTDRQLLDRQTAEDRLREMDREKLTAEEAEKDRLKQLGETLEASQKALAEGHEEEARRYADKALRQAESIGKEDLLRETIEKTAELNEEAYQQEIRRAEEAQAKEQTRQQSLRTELKKTEQSLKDARGQLRKLGDELAEVTGDGKTLQIKTNLSQVRGEVQQLQAELNRLFGTNSSITSALGQVGGQVVKRQAGGVIPWGPHYTGRIPGYGGGDRVKLLAEQGEYVLRKEAVAFYGQGFIERLNAMSLAPSAGDVVRRQAGGPVSGDAVPVSAPASSGAESINIYVRKVVAPDVRSFVRELEQHSAVEPLNINISDRNISQG